MKRWMLLTAAVVAALALLLILWGRDREPAPTATDAAPATRASDDAGAPAAATPATATATATDAAVTATREYRTSDGTRVRDRRTGAHEPFDIPSTPPRVPVQRLAEAEVGKVHAALHPLAMECARAVPDSELAPDAVVQVRMLVHVADGSLVADEVTATSRGLGERATSVEACVRDRASSIAIDVAEDHPAITRYPLTFPYRVRR